MKVVQRSSKLAVSTSLRLKKMRVAAEGHSFIAVNKRMFLADEVYM
jgi:hypothetical protein